MSEYTPGPWEVADGTRIGVTLPSLTEGVGYSSHCVAITHSSYGRLDAEANARLIAAAPELLDALIALVDAHAVPSSTCKERPAYEAALAAIAKATGDGYQGVRCQCIVTGCRPGPGCPIYSKTQCEAHMAFDRIAKATGEPT